MAQNIWSLYKITNLINGKIYIGQAADVSKRWYDHRRAIKLNKPTQIVHHAMIKYGLDSFEFEVIACCKTQEDANETETLLVSQYNSFVKNGNGYNATLGGYNAPKSEAWKQAMKDWRNSLSEEERMKINKKISEATIQQIATKGPPAQGTKRTPEQSQKLSQAKRKHPVIYTDEIRKHMSDAHLGLKDSEETKKRKSESIKESWTKRINYDGIKCQVPNCEIMGKAKYRIINEIRYCVKHGFRMLRKGTI